MIASKKMSRRSFFTMTAIGALSPCVHACAQEHDLDKIKHLLKQKDPLVWIFTGDSVTHGARHTYGSRSYPEIFAERVRWEMGRVYDFVINTGINGTNTSYLLGNFKRNVVQFKPAVVSVMYGINDCQEPSITINLFEQNLILLINRVREMGSIPILHTPNAIDTEGMKKMKTASRAKLPGYIEMIRKVAIEKQTILIDHAKHWQEKGINEYKNWLDDPLHPNAAGHIEMARLMFGQLSICTADSFTCTGNR